MNSEMFLKFWIIPFVIFMIIECLKALYTNYIYPSRLILKLIEIIYLSLLAEGLSFLTFHILKFFPKWFGRCITCLEIWVIHVYCVGLVKLFHYPRFTKWTSFKVTALLFLFYFVARLFLELARKIARRCIDISTLILKAAFLQTSQFLLSYTMKNTADDTTARKSMETVSNAIEYSYNVENSMISMPLSVSQSNKRPEHETLTHLAMLSRNDFTASPALLTSDNETPRNLLSFPENQTYIYNEDIPVNDSGTSCLNMPNYVKNAGELKNSVPDENISTDQTDMGVIFESFVPSLLGTPSTVLSTAPLRVSPDTPSTVIHDASSTVPSFTSSTILADTSSAVIRDKSSTVPQDASPTVPQVASPTVLQGTSPTVLSSVQPTVPLIIQFRTRRNVYERVIEPPKIRRRRK